MPREDDTTTTQHRGAAAALRLAASILGASGVALGAYGAHGGRHHPRLMTPGTLEQWKTAVVYQLVHAVAVLSISAVVVVEQGDNTAAVTTTRTSPTTKKAAAAASTVARRPFYYNHWATTVTRAGQCMALGSLLFSGSIYLLCLDLGPRKVLGPITPMGGLLMMAGWVMLGCGCGTST